MLRARGLHQLGDGGGLDRAAVDGELRGTGELAAVALAAPDVAELAHRERALHHLVAEQLIRIRHRGAGGGGAVRLGAAADQPNLLHVDGLSAGARVAFDQRAAEALGHLGGLLSSRFPGSTDPGTLLY
eukprot:SAG11_NODE_335_length_10564_cov_23.976015_7_plen_129_part_00